LAAETGMADAEIATGRRVPSPQRLNAEWYRAVSEGALHLQTCSNCLVRRHPPRYFCAACGSSDYTWEPVADNEGTLYSWSVVHRSTERGWADLVPYAVGVIELADSVRLVGYVDGIALDELELDAAVSVRAVSRQDGAALLVITAVAREQRALVVDERPRALSRNEGPRVLW
jgi:uncharacterized OB-fold protein